MTVQLNAFKVWFDWDFNGVFTEETANLVRCSGEARFAPPGQSILAGRGIVDSASVVLRNAAGRYSALNTGGALYAYMQSGGAFHVPMYVEASVNGGAYARVFTGVTKIPRESGRTSDGMPTVRFDCRGMDELLLQEKASTTRADFAYTYNVNGRTEAEAIDDVLGLSAATHTVTADKGLVNLKWVWLDDESILEEVWALAAAAGGRFYADVNGAYRYESMTHWLKAPHVTSQASYTNASWRTFEHWYDDNELYSAVEVEYATREIGESTVLWTPDEPVIVPAGSSRVITATFGQPAYSAPAITWQAATAGGLDVTASMTVSAAYYAQRAVLTLTNAHATRAAIVLPLEITAQPALGGPTEDETRTSAADGTNSAWWASRSSRTRSLRGNVYVQSRAHAGMLAQALLDWHERPRLFYRVSGLLGTPARRPGDRVTLNDTSVMSSARDAMVMALNWTYGNQSYRMDLECVDAAAWLKYATTSPGYFIIGGAGVPGNQLGAAHANRARLFY